MVSDCPKDVLELPNGYARTSQWVSSNCPIDVFNVMDILALPNKCIRNVQRMSLNCLVEAVGASNGYPGIEGSELPKACLRNVQWMSSNCPMYVLDLSDRCLRTVHDCLRTVSWLVSKCLVDSHETNHSTTALWPCG